jgi:hypothetical protein
MILGLFATNILTRGIEGQAAAPGRDTLGARKKRVEAYSRDARARSRHVFLSQIRFERVAEGPPLHLRSCEAQKGLPNLLYSVADRRRRGLKVAA